MLIIFASAMFVAISFFLSLGIWRVMSIASSTITSNSRYLHVLVMSLLGMFLYMCPLMIASPAPISREIVAGSMVFGVAVFSFALVSVGYWGACGGNLPVKVWNNIVSTLTWFGKESTPESRRPVYVLTALTSVFSGISVFSFPLHCGILSVLLMFMFQSPFFYMAFGRLVFDGETKFSNDFRVIGEDGKPIEYPRSFFVIISRLPGGIFRMFGESFSEAYKSGKCADFKKWYNLG